MTSMSISDQRLTSIPTSATVQKNVVTGLGPNALIAQNGIVVRGGGASATVNSNTVSGLRYTLDTTEACGLLVLDARRLTASKNTYTDVEDPFYQEGTSKGHVKP